MPAPNPMVRVVLPVVLGAVVGGAAVQYWHQTADAAGTAQSTAAATVASDGDVDTLRADVAKLKANAPSQSHTMADVGYQFANLWFAAEKKNWPLAQFYFNETRSHVLWTIRIRPVRRGPDGADVDLKPIFDGVDTSAFKAVTDAIRQQNSEAFVSAYRMTIEACYGCHKAAGMPFLRPMIPTVPPQTVINFDGAATWPE